MNINAGENASIALTLVNAEGSPIPANQVKSIVVALLQQNASKVQWNYVQGVAPATNVALADGLLSLELLATDTIALSFAYDLKISLTYIDDTYIASKSQTDVVCLRNFITIDKCPC